MIRRLLLPWWLALALFGAGEAHSQNAPSATGSGSTATSPANPGRLTAAEAQHVIDLLQDPHQRARLIETLRAIAKTSVPSETEKPSASPAPGAGAPAVTLAPDSLGAQLLSQLSSWPEHLGREAALATQVVSDFPMLWRWADRLVTDPERRLAVLNAGWQLALVVFGALFFEWLARLGLARPVAALSAYVPNNAHGPNGGRGGREPGNGVREASMRQANGAWYLLRRLPFALARLALDLIPVAVFWGAGNLFAGATPTPSTRFAILVIVNAYAASRIIVAVGFMLVSPESGRLRLLEIGDGEADYLILWLRRITLVAVVGAAAASLALLFGLNESAYNTLIRIVALIIAVLLGIMVLRGRQTVARRLRARSPAEGEALRGLARWRDWLAGAWHYLALTAIVAGWILWAAGIRNGLGGLRLLVGTVAIVVAARLAAIVVLGMIDRAARLSPDLVQRLPGAAARAAHYHAPTRLAMNLAIVFATGIALLQFWGADAFMWFEGGRIGGRLVSALVTIAVAAVAAIIVWEGANAALERRISRLSKAGSAAHAVRLRTLLPMLRAALLSVILAVVGLTALSEIGVNIGPLLAGAGVVGIAVGFGAQKLVQDVITGMFVLFENAIQIGDWVTVAGLSGIVERLSVRNIWLRSNDGAVHIVPFSAVTSITNTNRGLGNAAVSVTVAYKEDTDHIAEVLRGIAAEMRGDPAFGPSMLGDLQVWVEAVKASGVTLAGLIACTDAGRWPVQREFIRRLHQRFQELEIELSNG